VDAVHSNFRSVYVDKSKLEYDVEVPILSPALVTSTTGLETFGLEDIKPRRVSPPQPWLLREETFGYTGVEMLTLRVVERHEIERDFPADPIGYISVICRLIERECHLTGQFHRLAGLVKEYIGTVLFGVAVDMEEDYVLVRLNKPDAKSTIFEAFVEAIRERTVQPEVVRATGEVLRFSSTPGYEWSRSVYPGLKTVFNLVACDNEFETEFASFLDMAPDVAAYAKNNLYTHFSLDYQSREGAIRYYYPDFILRQTSGEMWLVETKGVEDVEVEHKDTRATQWCWNASAIAGVTWQYVKVPYNLFEASSATTFAELVAEIVVKTSSTMGQRV